MTYNAFGGTLNLTQSSPSWLVFFSHLCVRPFSRPWIHYSEPGMLWKIGACVMCLCASKCVNSSNNEMLLAMLQR